MSKAVQEGELRYFSPSSLDLALSCQRKWWYKYVDGKRTPETVAQTRGKEIHSRIEHFLRTGEDQLERTERAATPYMPAPDPRLLLEWEIDPDDLEVVLAGVPLHGYIDLAYDFGTRIDDDRQVHEVTPGTAVIKDWKTTRSKQWFKQPRTVQMTLYAAWAFALGFKSVFVSHVYILTRGAPYSEQMTARMDPDEVSAALYKYTAGVENMKRNAGIPDPELVPGNANECANYGGCPHLNYCSVGKQSILDRIFKNGGEGMSLIDKLKNRQAVKTLEYEEIWGRILSAGKGFPALSASVTAAIGSEAGETEGDGELAEYTIEDPADLAEFAAMIGVPPAAALPPDAPESDPAAHAPEPAEPPAEESPAEDTEGPTVADALATLKASKCGKVARLGAVAILEEALERHTLPVPSETPLDDFRDAVREWLGLS